MDYQSFINQFQIKLNQQQSAAVQEVQGPVLLLAVPGSGKTTVLVTRLAYMIYCCDIHPSNILTLTYTVAATNDMRERFQSWFGASLASKMEFRTLNSICAGIIIQYGKMIGKEPFKLESDEKVLLQIISLSYQKYESEYPAESDLKSIKTYITYIKNMMLSDEEIQKLQKEAGYQLLDIYKDYCNELKRRNCMDYDDQMVYAYRLLKSVPQLLEYYQNIYLYFCVDEAQDTSKIQHEIIALLASKRQNLFMVGDEDQSIYGFRAAYPAALLLFEKQYSGAKVLLMEENFRSNANIVDAANRFIQMNTLRHNKDMKAVKCAANEIKEIPLQKRKAQYSYLLKVAQECEEQTAVLYRDNESVIPLVDLLERNGVDYRIRNAELNFFSNRVVVDIQNIMRFSENMKNAQLFELIYYKLSTYMTKQMALEACEISREYNISIFSAIFGYFELKPHMRKNLKALETHFHNMRTESSKKAIYRILNFMGYSEYMERSGIDASKVFIMETIAEKEETMDGFLVRMEELKNIIQEKRNSSSCPFVLSTIHGSKGLEYDNVFLMDVFDGLFPEEVPKDLKYIAKEELETYEEERRLFYVAVTRAKHNLYLFKTQQKSTFINQLMNKETNMLNNALYYEQSNEHLFRNFNFGNSKVNYLNQRKEEYKNEFSMKQYKQFMSKLSVGMEVIHKKIGKGIIISLNENSIIILFDKEEKKFNLNFLFLNQLLEI